VREEVQLILPTSWEPNLDEFLTALGMSRGGLGEHFFRTVYDALFVTSIEVRDEFKKYYSVEYTNLAEYVEIRYGKTLSEDDLEAQRLFIVTWLPQVVDTMYDESKLDTVIECVEKLERTQNESKA
jgi:hypothetical protein